MGNRLTQREWETLQESVLFRELPEVRALLDGRGERAAFPKGTVIYSRKVYRRCVGIMLTGSAAVTGGGKTLLQLLRPAAMFGVAAVFSEDDRYVTDITARTDCTVLFLSGDELEELFRKSETVTRRYIAFLSDRIVFLNRKIQRFTAPDTESRLLLYLAEHASGDPPCCTVNNASELARILGMGRASLYRALDQAERLGRIRREGSQIVFCDRGDAES